MKNLLKKFFRKQVLLPVALLTLGSANAMAALVAGNVEVGSVTGKVNASFGSGNRVAVSTGAVLNAGATLYCAGDSSAELYFANGVKAVMLPGSELRITKFDIEQNGQVPTAGYKGITKEPSNSRTQVYVNSGKVLFEARSLNVPVSEFKVTTPLAVATVNGTVFYVEQADIYVKVGCAEGSVSVLPRVSVGAPVTLGEKETVVYRLRKSGETIEGVFEAVRPMGEGDYAGVLEQAERSSASNGQFVQGGIEVDLDSEAVIDHTLILVSPNGDGQGG